MSPYTAKAWFLYSEGNRPVEVFDTREAAVARLIKDYPLTPQEKRKINEYLTAQYVAYTTRLLVVGRTGESDRAVQRINGPSAWEEEQAEMRAKKD